MLKLKCNMLKNINNEINENLLNLKANLESLNLFTLNLNYEDTMLGLFVAIDEASSEKAYAYIVYAYNRYNIIIYQNTDVYENDSYEIKKGTEDIISNYIDKELTKLLIKGDS